MRALLIFLISVVQFSFTYAKVEKPTDVQKEVKPHKHQSHEKDDKHAHPQQKAEVQNAGQGKLTVKVHGLVCSFCAQGISKKFKERREVKSAEVDLDTMLVHVVLQEGQTLSTEELDKLIRAAGFTFGGLK